MDSSFQGFSPVLDQQAGNPEALKYGKLWETDIYRAVAPGEHVVQLFVSQANPKPGSTVIDFGCGTGRAALLLAAFGRMNVTMVDFTGNCLDPDIKAACDTQKDVLRFVKADLEKPLPVVGEYGFCTDVMEHIPTEKVDRVLDHILLAARHVFFQISLVDDVCGKLIGEPLHLTVQPFAWWLEQFTKRDCIIHWSKDAGEWALFYVTAWQDGTTVVDSGLLNEAETQIRENVRTNCAAGWAQVVPHERNELECVILGGGPSLNAHEAEIKALRANGAKLITLNGTYTWALAHGLTPSAQVMVDARPFNARFSKPVVDDCRYLIASQCHPSVLEGLPKERTYLWHTMIDLIEDLVKEHYEVAYPIPSCTTVLNTSMCLFRMLGYRRFHLFGCDSCLAPDQTHHAYSQPENDSEWIVNVMVTGGRTFQCHPWMVAQAQQFIDLIKFLGEEIELEVYGDGLLKHILDAGASMSIEEG